MSFIDPSAIQAIAHSVEVAKLSDEAARTLAPDVEYRLREVIQVKSLGLGHSHFMDRAPSMGAMHAGGFEVR